MARNDSEQQPLTPKGVHRKSRKRSVLTRTVAAGGAAFCIGAAYDLSTPTADALSILLPGPSVNGVGNTTRINILEGNIFNPQLGITNVSNSSTIGNVVMNHGNNILNALLSREISLGGAVGNGNTTQVNILSYNIFNPQASLAGNVSNNTSVNNVAINNGNNSTTQVSSAGGGLPLFGGAIGNGNTIQLSLFSGNIFNPQWTLFGANQSNNMTATNIAIGNGNGSSTSTLFGGFLGSFLFGGGNGNTSQSALFVSNIFNPQFSWGGGNVSNNSASTNTAIGNGNDSTNEVTGGAPGSTVVGTVGNGNTNQVANGSGNIFNDQVNFGISALSTGAGSVVQQFSAEADDAGSEDTDSGSTNRTGTGDTDDAGGADTDDGDDGQTPSSTVADDSTPSSGSTTDTGASPSDGAGAGGTGDGGGDSDGGDSGDSGA
jgi:hypothetical protein